MNNPRQNELPAGGINLVDIYFVVFRHKWKIIALTLLGLVAAGYYHKTQKPPYQSDAALLIRYVSDTRSMNPAPNDSQVISLLDQQGLNIIKSELEIMRSYDLATVVASKVGPDKILAKVGGGDNLITAADVIAKNLNVDNDGSVVHITFKSPDPAIVQPVLNALISAYLQKHDQIHRAIDLSDETLTEQTATLRQNIDDLDAQLRDAKAAVGPGIIDVASSQKFYADEVARLREALFEAQADLAEHKAVVNGEAAASLDSSNKTGIPATNVVFSAPLAPVPPEVLDQYKTAVARLAFAGDKMNGYLQQGFTDDNNLVKEVRDQIAAATAIKSELETNYPALAKLDIVAPVPTAKSSVAPAAASPAAADYAKSMLEDISLPARIKTLQAQLAEIQSEADKLGESEAKIADLQRRKEIQEDYYKSFANALQEEGINENMGPGRNSNIPEIQAPSPPSQDFKKFKKIFYALSVSGFVAGLGLAFLIEFYLDHTIRRPTDILNKLRIPLFLTIPNVNLPQRGSLAAANARGQLAYNSGSPGNGATQPGTPTSLEITAGAVNRRFDSYYDALRDRLVDYFESVNLTRKPKLIAVTSAHKGAGVSTIASGLAASLSETGDGRVLLVDMNHEQGTVQQFFQGRANCKLDDALETEKRDEAMVQENLYVVNEGSISDRLPRTLPKRFASLIPKLKASDYDYIIFDMPPVSPTSVTVRLAGFMDTMMLVVEAEQTSHQVVSQANSLLAQSKVNVAVVLNKTRRYIPQMLHHEFLYDV